MLFDVLALLFSWLPPPLNYLAFGAFCLFLLVVVIKLIAAIIDMIPFI